MQVTFKDVLVTSVTVATSRSGHPYARLQFLTDDMQVVNIMAFGQSVAAVQSLRPRYSYEYLHFQLVPAQNGGVQLVPDTPFAGSSVPMGAHFGGDSYDPDSTQFFDEGGSQN